MHLKIVLLNEICNEIVNRCHIIADRVPTAENPQNYTYNNFRVYIPENIKSVLNIKSDLNFLTEKLGPFNFFILMTLKSYNMYKNWSKDELNNHKKNIKNKYNINNYYKNFSLDILYNWDSSIIYDWTNLVQYMHKLTPHIYINDSIEIIETPEHIGLYEFAFKTLQLNFNTNILKEENDNSKLKFFETQINNLLNTSITFLSNKNKNLLYFNKIPLDMEKNKYDEYKKMVDINGPYIFEDFLKPPFIPVPDLMENKLNNNYGIKNMNKYFNIETDYLDELECELNSDLRYENKLYKSKLIEIENLTNEIAKTNVTDALYSSNNEDILYENSLLKEHFSKLEKTTIKLLKIINENIEIHIDSLDDINEDIVEKNKDDIEIIDSNLIKIDNSIIDDFEDFHTNQLNKIKDEFKDDVEDVSTIFKRNKDYVPHGKFGFEKTNPILTKSIFKSTMYLSSLRTTDNKRIFFKRNGSIFTYLKGPILDSYDIIQNKKVIATLFFDPYSDVNSTEAPEGFILNNQLK